MPVAGSYLEDCTGPEITAVPGRLRGYRWFSFNQRSPIGVGAVRLNLSQEGVPWSHRMTARCYPSDQARRWYARSSCQAPNPDSEHWCGLYGWYTPDRIDNVRGLNFDKSVLGVIEAWGRVLMGDQGFRAEHARILALSYVPFGRAGRICRRRGIAVYEDHEKMLADWPSEELSAIRELAPVGKMQNLRAQFCLLQASSHYFDRKYLTESVEQYDEIVRGYEARLAEIDRRGEIYRGQRAHLVSSIETWKPMLEQQLERLREVS